MIYDAPAGQFALHGAMPNAMSGMTFLKGTPLEALTLDNADVDGSVDTHGDFSLTLTKRLNLLEGQTTATVTVDNKGVHGSVGFTIWGFNKTVTLTGTVGFDGTYSFTGDLGLSLLGQAVDVSLTVDNHGIHGSALLHVLGYDVHVQGDLDQSGTFRLVGSRFMKVGEAGWSFFQVTWDQNGLTIDNGGPVDFLYTRLKESWIEGGTVFKEVWDTAGNDTLQVWNSLGQYIERIKDAVGNITVDFLNSLSHSESTTYTTGEVITRTWYLATQGIYHAGDYVETTVTAAGDTIKETWYKDGDHVKETWDKAGNYTSQVLNSAGQEIGDLAQKTTQTFTDVWNALRGI
jgi:hypothetical protein